MKNKLYYNGEKIKVRYVSFKYKQQKNEDVLFTDGIFIISGLEVKVGSGRIFKHKNDVFVFSQEKSREEIMGEYHCKCGLDFHNDLVDAFAFSLHSLGKVGGVTCDEAVKNVQDAFVEKLYPKKSDERGNMIKAIASVFSKPLDELTFEDVINKLSVAQMVTEIATREISDARKNGIFFRYQPIALIKILYKKFITEGRLQPSGDCMKSPVGPSGTA